ncbi:GGDEF domain-containing protein [Aestuariibius sp. 2305UL40-4]|uniref:GGDEF domain-containing protein n=1 Tax=Aestuariibius violaceus TaxID=3234132 RepID=UPI00345EF78C
MRFLIRMMAVRNPLDAVLKGLVFFSVINGTALSMELVLYGQLAMPFWWRTLLTLAASLPFIVLVFWVVTHLERLQHKLADLAATDVLTGLPNRRAFFAEARQSWMKGKDGVLFIVDADHFKAINDTYGHAVGDLCLQAAAERMRAILRQADLIGRIGGEEFAVFMSEISIEEAEAIGDRLSTAIVVDLGADEPIRMTMSVGGVEQRFAHTLDHLMHLADMALYRAKALGRARMIMWEPQMGDGGLPIERPRQAQFA